MNVDSSGASGDSHTLIIEVALSPSASSKDALGGSVRHHFGEGGLNDSSSNLIRCTCNSSHDNLADIPISPAPHHQCHSPTNKYETLVTNNNYTLVKSERKQHVQTITRRVQTSTEVTRVSSTSTAPLIGYNLGESRPTSQSSASTSGSRVHVATVKLEPDIIVENNKEDVEDDERDMTPSQHDHHTTSNGAIRGSTAPAASTPVRELNSGGDSKEPDRYGFFGGDQYTHDNEDTGVSVDIVRSREMKWLHMLDNWDVFMQKQYDKVRERCRKGIPSAIRCRAWQHLCGAYILRSQQPRRFTELLNSHADPKHIDDIEKDLHRLFPHHEMFATAHGIGQSELYKVLKAYSVYNPEDGYCQAHGPLAAVLLMHMPAEEAFWCLVAICDRYLPGYYSHGLEALKLHAEVLFALVKRRHAPIYQLLKNQNVDPILYMTEWFMCVFSRTLPWSSVLRVWDMFFCEGVKVIFRVSLVLINSVLGSPQARRRCSNMYDTLDSLRKIPKEYLQEAYLIPRVLKIKVTEDELAKIHRHCLKVRKVEQEKEQQKRQRYEEGKQRQKGRGGGDNIIKHGQRYKDDGRGRSQQ